jgi:glutathione S-transferase
MALELYAHPFSSYCWKVMIAFHEKDVDFELRQLSSGQPENDAAFAQAWPLQKLPLLVADGQPIMESSIIIEWLDLRFPDPPLLPADRSAALEVRMLDRIFDNYLETSFQTIVFDRMTGGDGLAPLPQDARARLRRTYAWLDAWMQDRKWAVSGGFSLADCAAAPALFYADWTEGIPSEHEVLWAYRRRLLARPSVARCVEGARPYRHFFPLGAPDRD